MMPAMSTDDDEKEKPSAVEDVRKGLGLLFRAAKTTLDKLPTKKVEEAVVSGAKEVSRAFENVTSTIEKQVFKKDEAKEEGEEKKDEPDAKPEEPKGPRVE
jgi:hypothetical protein